MFLRWHHARTASRVETSGGAALDAVRARRKGLGITNADETALVPPVKRKNMGQRQSRRDQNKDCEIDCYGAQRLL
ncbi:hypothetical protein BDS110ZK14_56490 [Bradyrhizobium diazoefficiens]|nr:hypothetical protein XF15B_59080 [Bradyrhizobium diazoefficiens]